MMKLCSMVFDTVQMLVEWPFLNPHNVAYQIRVHVHAAIGANA
jgi:hypothetical protein